MECQLASLGSDAPQVANSFYLIGVNLNKVGRCDAALIALERGARILFPKRHMNQNMDLAATFYEIGTIYGSKKKDYKSALSFLDLAKQVETHILGHALDATALVIVDYQKKKRTCTRRMSS